MRDIENELKTIIIECAERPINVDEISQECDLFYDLSFSSLSFIQLIVSLESKLNITFFDDELDLTYFKHYHHLLDLVSSKLNDQGGKTS